MYMLSDNMLSVGGSARVSGTVSAALASTESSAASVIGRGGHGECSCAAGRPLAVGSVGRSRSRSTSSLGRRRATIPTMRKRHIETALRMDRWRKATANAAGTVARWSAGVHDTHDLKTEPTPVADQRPCEYGNDGRWRETTSKSDIHSMACSSARPAVLFTGSTNVRVWAAERGVNTDVVQMKQAFSSVSCMHVFAAEHSAADVRAGAATSQETVWCGHTDGSVTAIDADGLHECRGRFSAHRSAVTALAVVGCESELWTGSVSGTIRAWPDHGCHQEHSAELALPAHAESSGAPEIKALLYMPASQTVWSAAHSGIHVWHARTHGYQSTLPGSGKCTCLAVVGAGLIVSGHSDGRVALWGASETGGGRLVRELFKGGWDAAKGEVGSGHRVTALCACPLPALPELSILADAALWAGFADGSLYAYLASTGELLAVIKAHNSTIVSLAYFIPADDGGDANGVGARVVTASTKGTLRVWGGDGLMWKERRQLAWVSARSERCMTSVDCDIAVATWNVNAKDHSLDGADGISRWLAWRNAGGMLPPALYVVGFQEVVPLNAAEMISVSTENALAWQLVVGQALATSEGGMTYTCVGSQQLVGILLLIFARDDMVQNITDISTAVVKTGIGGMGGNKGGVGVRLKLFETPIVFCCTHLAAHQGGADERDEHYHQIAQDLSFPVSKEGAEELLLGRGGADRISSTAMMASERALLYSAASQVQFGHVGLLDTSHPFVFWLGDVNYRIDLSRSEAITLIQQTYDTGATARGGAGAREWEFAKERAMEQLRAHDQLNASRTRESAFDEFEEPPLNFRPTYKFDPGTLDTYDSSEKQRIPAWCDRVLYRRSDRGGRPVQVNGYTSVESLISSDHKPVIGSFTMSVQRCANRAASAQLRQQFEAVVPPRAASAAFPTSAMAKTTSPRSRGSGDQQYSSSVRASQISKIVALGLQGVGSVQWGGKGAWVPMHVQLTGPALRLRGTGFGAETSVDGVIVLDLLGTDARRPTTVRKGHPYAFRINLCGADRLKHGTTKVLCDLDDESGCGQWILALNDAASPAVSAAPSQAPAAAAARGGGLNGGLDEDAALRAAISLSAGGGGGSAAYDQAFRGDSSDEDDVPLQRRQPAQTAADPFAAPRPVGIFSFGAPEPEPEPEFGAPDIFGAVPFGSELAPPPPAQDMFAEVFGINQAPAPGAAGVAAAAALDPFGSAPFDGTGSNPFAAAPAPAGADVFGMSPFK